MNAREAEARLLERCASIAAGEADIELDDVEANVVRVAAMLARSHHPVAATRLRDAAAAHFERHPSARCASDELVRRGVIVGLPRFRAMLDARLAGS